MTTNMTSKKRQRNKDAIHEYVETCKEKGDDDVLVKSLVLCHGLAHTKIDMDKNERPLYVDKRMKHRPNVCLDISKDLNTLQTAGPFSKVYLMYPPYQAITGKESLALKHLDGLLSDSAEIWYPSLGHPDWIRFDRVCPVVYRALNKGSRTFYSGISKGCSKRYKIDRNSKVEL